MTDVSVVIPTLGAETETLASVPDGVETAVVREGGRSEARNSGARQTSGDLLVFCDDDIAFETDWFWRQVKRTPPGVVTGLEDFDFGMLLTRFMVVHRADFERVGGFDARLQHLEDTEFCVRARKHRLGLRALPRDAVTHHEHDTRVSTTMRATHLARVLAAHPLTFAPHLADLLGWREWRPARAPNAGHDPRGQTPTDHPADAVQKATHD